MHPSPAPSLDRPTTFTLYLCCASSARETLQHIVSATTSRPLRRPLLVIHPPSCLARLSASSQAQSALRSASLPPPSYNASPRFSSSGAHRRRSIASIAAILLRSSLHAPEVSANTPRHLCHLFVLSLTRRHHGKQLSGFIVYLSPSLPSPREIAHPSKQANN